MPFTIKVNGSTHSVDVDGDGSDEAILVVRWLRDTIEPGKRCGGCDLATGEKAEQLYVIGGATLGGQATDDGLIAVGGTGILNITGGSATITGSPLRVINGGA